MMNALSSRSPRRIDWVKPLGIGFAAALAAGVANPLTAMPSYSRAIGTLLAAGPLTTFSMDAHIIGAGSAVESESACFRLRATIADTVAGHSQSASYTLESGFMALDAAAFKDPIFMNDFEECSP